MSFNYFNIPFAAILVQATIVSYQDDSGASLLDLLLAKDPLLARVHKDLSVMPF